MCFVSISLSFWWVFSKGSRCNVNSARRLQAWRWKLRPCFVFVLVVSWVYNLLVGVTVTNANCMKLSGTVLLSRRRSIITISVIRRGMELLGGGLSPVISTRVRSFLIGGPLGFATALSGRLTCSGTRFIVVTAPASCSIRAGCFGASSIRTMVGSIVIVGPGTIVVVGSAIPINCATHVGRRLRYRGLVFSPRFLHRNGTLCSGLRPSHVIINRHSRHTRIFTGLLLRNTIGGSIRVLCASSARTRTMGLFSGACLTLHITCFGRLSACTRSRKLSAHRVVSNMDLSPHVNSRCGGPSFNCNNCYLPGSAGRLHTGCSSIPGGVVNTVISSGAAHGSFVTSSVVGEGPEHINVCQLIVGSNSSGFHTSDVRNVVGHLGTGNVRIIIFRPRLGRGRFFRSLMLASFRRFGSNYSIVISGHVTRRLTSMGSEICAHSLFNSSWKVDGRMFNGEHYKFCQ